MTINDKDIAVVKSDSHLSKWIGEHGRLDIQEEFLKLFQHHITAGGVVADVGACLGDHALTYSRFVGERGFVHAFEPNPVACECLTYNLKHMLPNVIVHPYGLGAVTTTAHVISRIGQEDNLGAKQLKEGGSIRIETLDVVAQHWLRLDFLKIDAEGWEPDVLAGAKETIMRFRPVMLVEVNRPVLELRGHTPSKLFNMIVNLGYTYRPSEPHIPMDSDQLDVLCIPL
jgi:FkbM family methyltransferase